MKKYFITGNAKDEAGGSYNERKGKKITTPDKNSDQKVKDEEEEGKNKSSFKEALQQWSNDNERDIAEDNSTPLRSNL